MHWPSLLLPSSGGPEHEVTYFHLVEGGLAGSEFSVNGDLLDFGLLFEQFGYKQLLLELAHLFASLHF